MKTLKQKLMSRKFWISILAMIGGIATSLSGYGGKIGAIAGIVVSAVSALTYIVTEGIIDAKAVQLTADTVKTIIDELKKEDESGTEAK